MTAVLTLALAGAAHAFTVEIVLPSSDPVLIATDRPQAFEAVAYDDQQQDVTSEVTWSWDFDDGSAADTDNPTEHVFETAGDYTVTVTGVWSAQQQQDDAQITIDAQDGTGTFVLARGGPTVFWSMAGNEMCHTRYVIAFEPQGRYYDTVSFNRKYSWVPEFTYQPWFTQSEQITLDNVQYNRAWVAEWTSSECPGQAEAGEFNAAVDWQMIGYYEEDMEPVPELIGEKTWTINNTVVSSPAGVLLFDPEDEELDSCEISWTTTHQNAFSVQFAVPIHIYDLAGNELYSETKTDVPLGNDSWIWNGTITPQEPEGPDKATKGIYTYRLGVVGESGTCGGVRCACTGEPSCARGDWDKSAFLEISNVGTPVWDVDLVEHEINFSVSYTLSAAANALAVRVYGPGLDQVFAQTGLPTDAGSNQSQTYTIPISLTGAWCGPYHVVLYGWESATDGEKNRDRAIKPALHKGVVRTLYPRAENYVWTGYSIPEIGDSYHERRVVGYSRYDAYYAWYTDEAPTLTRADLEDYPDRGFPACALMVFKGHANPTGGFMGALCNPEVPSWRGDIHAVRNGDMNDWDMAVDDHRGEWAHVRLVVWMGCGTGIDHPDYGHLPTETTANGAACSIGWLGSNTATQACYWLEQFVYYACYSPQSSISDAASNADLALLVHFGLNTDLDILWRSASGSTSISLVPAGYGG